MNGFERGRFRAPALPPAGDDERVVDAFEGAQRSLVRRIASLQQEGASAEALVDLVHPGRHPAAGRVKDVAAAAVLVAAVASAGVGLAVLGPPLVEWIGSR